MQAPPSAAFAITPAIDQVPRDQRNRPLGGAAACSKMAAP